MLSRKPDSVTRMKAAVASMDAALASTHDTIPCPPPAMSPRPATRFDKQIWLRFDFEVKAHLLARGIVQTDDEGHPVISGDVMAIVLQDIVRAMAPAQRRVAR